MKVRVVVLIAMAALFFWTFAVYGIWRFING